MPQEPGASGGEDESVAYFLAHHDEIEARERHWSRRVVPSLAAVALVLATVVLFQSVIGARDAVRQSNRTQADGLRAAAQVVTVQNSKHTWVSSGTRWTGPYASVWYRAKLTVNLQTSIAGTSTTTVYAPEPSTLVPGAVITVLVDPRDPRYAELPGKPLELGGGWIVLLGFLVLVLLGDVACVSAVAVSLVRRRRSARPAST